MKNVPSKHSSSFPDLLPAFYRRRRERVAQHPAADSHLGMLLDKATDAICTDLSEGGVAFDCSSELNVGDLVILEFHQKGEAAYRCHARVAYCMGRRYGAYLLAGE